jgi:ATP-dependent RNA helicase SUPV3L1/SUV3
MLHTKHSSPAPAREAAYEAGSASRTAPLASKIVAMLGPTNTGKTHHCIERMLEFDSGMLGLPLRLLAREVYDKLSERIGQRRVALVTGEEKRVPSRADYWICTVEAMPMDLEVDFLAIDEIQLIAHPTRGHVFTQRLLHARGRHETWFLGSDTVSPLLRQLLPTANFESRPRLSRLSHAGQTKLAGLPVRSAIVAFNASQVYELAERIRAKRGGAAVVLGALSPRTRNAQVAMYQAGEVDYLVATDAIGMGLNLSLSHVAFSALHKFDGRERRDLSLAEMGQIAGRAGRHLKDGTFGTLSPCRPLPDSAASIVESHRFARDRHAIWRNHDLDFSSLSALTQSLEARPSLAALRRVATSEDSTALAHLARKDEVEKRVRGTEAVSLLWQVCQIPDYRKLLPELHAELLLSIFEQLSGSTGRISEDWLQERVARLDDTSGDIEALMGRIAFIRTWTYVSHRADWVGRSKHWQAATRRIEDRLSDALHDRLVQRFVEKTRKWSAPKPSTRGTGRGGLGEQLAALRADMARPDDSDPSAQLESWVDASHDRFTLTSDGLILVDEVRVGRLRQGNSLHRPDVGLDVETKAGERLRLERRLRAFVRDAVGQLLHSADDAPGDSAAVRGLLYQLREGLGSIDRRAAREQLLALTHDERRKLKGRGIRIGARVVFMPALLRPRALRIRAALCRAHHGGAEGWPAPENTVHTGGGRLDPAWVLPAGYVAVGDRQVRCDVLEKAVREARRASPDPAKLCSLLACKRPELSSLVAKLVGRSRRRSKHRNKRPRHQ